jgi:HD superfamily phosphodiesterase
MRYAESINDAVALLETIDTPSYNVLHAKGVVDLALNIASFYETDRELLEVACWWHDTGRVEGIKNHELLSASLAYENLALHGHPRKDCKFVYDAIRFHRVNHSPKTFEGKILRDADKLDMISVDRWKQCIEFKDQGIIADLTDRKRFIRLIPKLRTKILYLDHSKEMFDHMLSEFLDFMSHSHDSEVRGYFNELIQRAIL